MSGSVRRLEKVLRFTTTFDKAKTRRDVVLILSNIRGAVSAVLVREEGREHQPIYYVSKTLQGPEERYPQIEKLASALVTAARKLRPYFQSHPVVVLTNHPLKKILAEAEYLDQILVEAPRLDHLPVEARRLDLEQP
ncbi:UNVERIFIED_CONTAM: hypothetical protein Sradi_0723700 [Sesamum radiatum]|uniref:Reverse transcriptase RNase H-like domain-containing protein n=1 Tax=Sesamum radiatum TaxID=300843 RepID=A0AAW2VNC1_SESRA